METNASESGSRQCCRILVAEDHEVNQKVAQLILEKAGFQVDIVADGRQAVAAHKENAYDLILLDIQMPVMDGQEAAQKIRNWESEMRNKIGAHSDPTPSFQLPTSAIRRVPIIAMTGEAVVDGFDPQRYPGMDDWVCKPLQRDHLLSIMHRWIDRPSGEVRDQIPERAAADPVDNADGKKLPIDLDRALDEFMGKKDILFEVLDQFMSRSGDQIADLRTACGRSDYRAVASDAHRLKGAAANLRADGLARAASALETAAETEKNDEVCNLIEKLAEEFHRLERFLQQKGVHR